MKDYSPLLRNFLLSLLIPAVLLLSACVTDSDQAVEQSDRRSARGRPASGYPLSDTVAVGFMYDLIGADEEMAGLVRTAVVESGDERFIPVFIELMWGSRIGIVQGENADYVAALERLSGQSFGDAWPDWIRWYGATEIEPPPLFTGWKGQVYSQLDTGYSYFLRDGAPASIRTEEVVWGGVPINGIVPLEEVAMIPAAEADYLLDEEPVFGVEVNGEARAYPLRIVDNHEMVSDTVGGVPVQLSYCTLCGAAILYDRRGSAGEVYEFGTTGLLYRSNKLMYDRRTRSLWNQLTGRPVVGDLAGRGIRLKTLPVVMSRWADWLARHPDTLVLDRKTGVFPPETYLPGALYGGYYASSEAMFPIWRTSDRLGAKDIVYALTVDGVPAAWDVRSLAAERVVNDTVGDAGIVLLAPSGIVRAEGIEYGDDLLSYTTGAEVRAYARNGIEFLPGSGPGRVTDTSGDEWRVTEAALIANDGRSLSRLPGHLVYWFGWYAFFPETELRTGE